MALGPLGVCFAMLGISILLEWLGVAESRQHRAPHRGGNGAMQANADLSWVSLSVAGDVANTRRWCCLCLCNGRSSRGGRCAGTDCASKAAVAQHDRRCGASGRTRRCFQMSFHVQLELRRKAVLLVTPASVF